MKHLVFVSLLSAFVANSAFAEDSGKFYFAGDIGSASYSNMEPFANPGTIRIAAGSHLSNNLSAEMAYSKFGDSTITGPGGSVTLSASAFQIAGIGSLPLNPQFDLTAKLGFSHNTAKLASDLFASADTTNNGLLLGIGAQYHIDSQFTVRAQYDNYGDFESGTNPMKASSITIGIVINL